MREMKIVRRVEGLFALADQLELRLAKARGQVDQLTPSLPPSPGYGGTGLARAFRGKLVPQEPADEPAFRLLERIRSPEQADSTPTPIRKGKV
jgi:type I restriction enzyme S subunit